MRIFLARNNDTGAVHSFSEEQLALNWLRNDLRSIGVDKETRTAGVHVELWGGDACWGEVWASDLDCPAE